MKTTESKVCGCVCAAALRTAARAVIGRPARGTVGGATRTISVAALAKHSVELRALVE